MLSKIRDLLSSYFTNEELEKYKCFLNNENTVSTRSITIPTKQAIIIYSLRESSPAALSGKVTGFTKLLNILNKVEDSQTSIHKLSSYSEHIIVFTDCSITKLFGVLYFTE